MRSTLEKHKKNSATEDVLNDIGDLSKKPEFDKTNPDGKMVRAGRWSANLQTTFKKILKRNSIKVWPQPFRAIRKFRINELERDPAFRTTEIWEWTGNNEATAQKHYSKATREDRQRAAGILKVPQWSYGGGQIASDRFKSHRSGF